MRRSRVALRSADAVYVATARHARATLLTLDAELRERAAGVVAVRTPIEWFADVARDLKDGGT